MHAELGKEPPVLENILSFVKDRILLKEGKDDGGMNGRKVGREEEC